MDFPPIIEHPHTAEWGKRLGYTILSIIVLGNFIFRPQRFTDALITYISLLSLWPIPVGLLVYALLKYPSKSIVVYVLYFLLTHKRDSHHTGSEVSTWLGKGYFASGIKRYLNASIHAPHLNRLQTLSREGTKYIFAVHPHSLFGISTLVHFATARLFTKDLLGLDFRVCTINMNFLIPVLREYLMARGFVCADKRTFSQLLARNISPVIVPGGAEETLFSSPGSADLVVGKRTGFVREAIRNGAWLVPVYCFGDNDALPAFRLPRSIMVIQRIVQKWLSFALPLGLPIFNRSPIKMVIGSPLPPPASGCVHQYHSEYLEALKRLFNENVAEFGSKNEINGKGIRFLK